MKETNAGKKLEKVNGRNPDFIYLIKSTLLERVKKNPNYSLRAFAKSVGVNHAHLSLILRGKRPVTVKLVKKISSAIGLGPQQTAMFMGQIPLNQISFENIAYQNLDAELFESISDWHHDAILELVRLPNFSGDLKFITKKLGISHIKASDAVERLKKLELLSCDGSGKIVSNSPDTTTNTSNETTSAALRNYQKNVLEKSIETLFQLPRTQRDHSSMTVAMDINDLAKAKKLIADFRAQFMALMQKDPKKMNEVFQLSVSLFPLTKIEDNKKFEEENFKTKDLNKSHQKEHI